MSDHLGVDATERSRGGALDGGVDGDGGQIPVWGGGDVLFNLINLDNIKIFWSI